MVFSTFGELRRELASEGLTWTVNQHFSDTTQIPRPALGADFTRWPLASDVPRSSIRCRRRRSDDQHAAQDLSSRPRARSADQDRVRTGAGLGGTDGANGRYSPGRGHGGSAWARGQPGCHGPAELGGLALPVRLALDHRDTRPGPVRALLDLRLNRADRGHGSHRALRLVPRSEGDYIEANKVPCGQCGNAGEVLSWVQATPSPTWTACRGSTVIPATAPAATGIRHPADAAGSMLPPPA